MVRSHLIGAAADPQVQMKSIGRSGYFSWQKAGDAPRIRANANTNPNHFSPFRFMVIVLQSVF